MDFHPLQDFRMSGSAPLSTSSLFIIREVQQKQSWIGEDLKDIGQPKLEFVGSFSTDDNPKIIAKSILETLNINPWQYLDGHPMKEWIDKSESKGIFCFTIEFYTFTANTG